MEDNLKNENGEEKAEILSNDYGETKDSAVVIEEENRTVLLTEDETVVIEKTPEIDIAPKNRPRKVYAGMWGKAEIVTVSLALLAVLTMILFFVFMVLPAQKDLEENRAKRDQLERELANAKKKYGDITSTEEQVAKLSGSVNDFETRFLRPVSTGQVELYQRLNGLISAYGLVNTSGPDYQPLEIIQPQKLFEGGNESGRAKFESLYPGTYITTTVEGSYQSLRRFIREIEQSGEFIMITAVELEPAESQSRSSEGQTAQNRPTVDNVTVTQNFPGTQTVNPNAPTVTVQTDASRSRQQSSGGRTIGETVSLRIEMAAYFRRPDFVPLQATVTEERE